MCLSFIAALVLWGWTVLLGGPASSTRVGIAAVFIGVYLSHYIHLKAAEK